MITKLTSIAAAVLLVACGGGGTSATAPVATATADVSMTPFYSVAPIDLETPVNNAIDDPHVQMIPDGTNSPVIATYTPAQIRAAYNMPPIETATPAELGAGQTIYIVDAFHNPNIAEELAAFNQKFNLPGCSTKVVTSVPLALAGNTCELAVVYSTGAATMTTVAPAYDEGWAMESALDVQWAHATAPLARIVLIEAPDTMSGNMVSAIKLANAMGPGAVSMSFGAPEGGWSLNLNSAFNGMNMSYYAATGDTGSSVQWPAVSPNVVAVGGTSLSYSGGLRSEVSWKGTGGGTSSYTGAPSYQTTTMRTVADVSFNADPATGQYVAFIPNGKTAVTWLGLGGTSLATPQWAGIGAVTNAVRASLSKAALNNTNATLYAASASYTGIFTDVTTGINGTCYSCKAGPGYDMLAGLGTPNVSTLVAALSSGIAPAAPVTPTPTTPVPTTGPSVTATSFNGVEGKPLTGTITIADPGQSALSLSIYISERPPGMRLSVKGLEFTATWASPVVGTYSLTVMVTDRTGKKVTSIIPVVIVPK